MALPTFKEFDGIAKFNMGFAEGMMHKFGYVAPILHLFYTNAKDEIVQIRIPDSPDVPPMSVLVGNIIQQRQANAYLVTNEAWGSQISKEELQLPPELILRAKYRPDRFECITVVGEHPQGTCAYSRRFTRSGNKVIFEQGPLENCRMDGKGNMGNLLRPQG